MNTQDFVADERREFIPTTNAFARSAFGARGGLASLFAHRRVGSKSDTRTCRTPKLREIEQKLFSIPVHLRVSWVKSLLQK